MKQDFILEKGVRLGQTCLSPTTAFPVVNEFERNTNLSNNEAGYMKVLGRLVKELKLDNNAIDSLLKGLQSKLKSFFGDDEPRIITRNLMALVN